ncbi:MAG: DNA mismatch repair protein MutH [Myxococcales bacterium]|nr:DNA mismatch repair protein MutH [Myxococcales bacterium]
MTLRSPPLTERLPALDDPRVVALVAHARSLVGARLADIADGLGLPVPVGNVRTKGWSGQIIERELGGTEETSHGPDFEAFGVELKTVPVDGAGKPLESTAVCVIDPIAIAGESWDTSHVRRKLCRVLFVALRVPGRGTSVGDREVADVRLWQPSATEEALLRADFELFSRDYFRVGRAAALTGHLGQVLQVRPKAKNARDQRRAYDDEGRPVRIGKCGFYLRPAFVGAILRAPLETP